MGALHHGGIPMKVAYNQVTSQSVERLAALSDGIFAVAMTLLVLELHGPAREAIHSEGELWDALCAMMPQIVTWLMSFLTLGIFWSGQQVQLNEFERSDRHLAWIHLAFLSAISVMPFSTRLLADYIAFKTALLCYWVNIAVPGMILFTSWRYARRAGLVRKEMTPVICRAVERRIVVAQLLYAVGATLCVVNDYASIGFIVLAQLNFAIAPRIPLLSKF
jgi:uncharacterized membrane protein